MIFNWMGWWWEGALSELLCTDDLVLMSETINGFRNNFLKWREVFESKCLKVILWNTKVMFSSDITKDGLSKSTVDQCGICSLRVMANWVLCVHVVSWCTEDVSEWKWWLACRYCEGNIGEAVEQEEKLCNEVELILVIGWVEVEYVRLLWQPEQVMIGLRLGSVVSYCMVGCFLKTERGCLWEIHKDKDIILRWCMVPERKQD